MAARAYDPFGHQDGGASAQNFIVDGNLSGEIGPHPLHEGMWPSPCYPTLRFSTGHTAACAGGDNLTAGQEGAADSDTPGGRVSSWGCTLYTLWGYGIITASLYTP